MTLVRARHAHYGAAGLPTTGGDAPGFNALFATQAFPRFERHPRVAALRHEEGDNAALDIDCSQPKYAPSPPMLQTISPRCRRGAGGARRPECDRPTTHGLAADADAALSQHVWDIP
jgi:hypothetical protein